MKCYKIFFLILFVAITSCQQEDFLRDSDISDSTDIKEDHVHQFDYDTLAMENAVEYEIEEDADFAAILTPVVTAIEEKMLKDGWLPELADNLSGNPVSRAVNVRTDTVWSINCYAVDSETQQQMYFKAKFGSKMVDAINAKVDNVYKIATGTTYCCEWQLMGTYYNLKSNESFAMVDSPLSGLNPDTRSDYWTRGYKVYTHQSSNGSIQKQMHSYRVRIINKDTSKPTVFLNIYWPAEILDEPYRGYQFIYRILSR